MIDIDRIIKTKFVKEIINDKNQQTLTLLPNEELKIVITIPHNVFEWFVEVFDKQGKKVHSNWIDHYGDTEVNLKSEMKESVEGFILAVTKHPLRLIDLGKPEQSILEIYRNEQWTDTIY